MYKCTLSLLPYSCWLWPPLYCYCLRIRNVQVPCSGRQQSRRCHGGTTLQRLPSGLFLSLLQKEGFLGIAGFPRVLGCIDGTHVAIKVSKEDKPVYLNRKGYTVKWPGSTHDSFMWRNCDLYEKFCAGTAPDGWLPGDAGYSVQPWLMTPIRAPKDEPEEEYNEALTKTRQVIERTFGLLQSRFRCLDKSGGVLQYKPQICCRITVACVVLHNYCMRHHVSFNEPLFDLSEDEEEEEDDDDDDDDGVQPTSTARTRRARTMAMGASVRDALVRHAFT
ncbi:putative nuclease HARBI1 [Ixodes scapularis]